MHNRKKEFVGLAILIFTGLAIALILAELGARLLPVPAELKEAEKMLGKIDKEQRDFFKKVFGKTDASAGEFDMVINCDFISEPQQAAEIVAGAYKQKFGSEIKSIMPGR